MSSYLIYSKDEAYSRRTAAVIGAADASPSLRRVPDGEESLDYKFRETEGIKGPEREAAAENSSASASIDDEIPSHHELEASASFLDEYHDHGDKKKNMRKNPRYNPRRKNSGASTSSSNDSTQSYPAANNSRIMEIYCLLLSVALLFTLGLMAGRHIWEYPVSSSSPSSSVISGVRDSSDKNLQDTPQIPKITVGTYYYPWHGGDFHRGAGYVRKSLGQSPALGEYDDRDPNTISQHLAWSKEGNIGLWVASWWGAYEREDNTTRTVILNHEELKKGGPFENHKVALFYETFGRIREEDYYSLHRIKPDMEFICEHYLSHPNYYTLDDGRPVLFVYLTRHLETLVRFESVIHIMRKTVKDACGKDIYIIGDQIFGRFDPPGYEVSAEQRLVEKEDKLYSSTPTAFDLLDGVTNYDVYGSMGATLRTFGGYVAEDSVADYYLTVQRKWRKYAKEQKGCSFIPAVSPGYNDLGVRPKEEHTPLARSLKRATRGGKDSGSFFRVSIEHARTLVDPSASYLLMVNSFNEWHEDTQIEPVIGEPASTPYNMTFGIEYDGYGTLYLDILRNGTKDVNIVV